MNPEKKVVRTTHSERAGASVAERLLPRHFRILELDYAGHSAEAIAKTLGIHKDTVYYVRRSPLYQAEMARRRREDRTDEILAFDRNAVVGKARSILEQASEAAAQKHVELLEAENEGIQLKAAGEILDRVFGKTGEKNSTPVVHLSAEHIEHLTLALKESNHANGQSQRDSSADGQATQTPSNREQGDVREEADGGQGLGHRQAQTQGNGGLSDVA